MELNGLPGTAWRDEDRYQEGGRDERRGGYGSPVWPVPTGAPAPAHDVLPGGAAQYPTGPGPTGPGPSSPGPSSPGPVAWPAPQHAGPSAWWPVPAADGAVTGVKPTAQGHGSWAPPVPTGGGPGAAAPATGRRRGLRGAWQRVVTTLAALAAFLAKFGALALKVKYLGLVLSMFVSVVAYALLWGWSFALGFVLLMLVHEMGHVIELRRQGVRASLPMFVPFLGAFVNMRESPRSAYQEAMSGLAGPYFGTAASVVLALWGHATGSVFLTQLAAVGFMLNLFNLLPMLPLDGGRAAAALHPALWLAGLVGLLALVFISPSPVLLLVLVMGGVELWKRWSARRTPGGGAYYRLLAHQRWLVGGLYVLVVATTLVGFQLTYVARAL